MSRDRRPLDEHAAPPPTPDAEPPGERWSRVLFPGETGRALAHEVLAALAAAHPAGRLRIALRLAPERQAEWAWTTRLPHTRDGAPAIDAELATRPDFGARPALEEPLIVVVLDGAEPGDRLATRGVRNTVVLDLDDRRRRPGRTTLRLEPEDEGTVRAAWMAPDRTKRSASLPGAHAAAFFLAPDATNRAAGDPATGHRAPSPHRTGTRRRPSRSTRVWPPPETTTPPPQDRPPSQTTPQDQLPHEPAPPAGHPPASTGYPPASTGHRPAGARAGAPPPPTAPAHPDVAWPPTAPPTIDHLLPPLVPIRDLGLTIATPMAGGPLTVPAGVLDPLPDDALPGVLRVDLSGHLLITGAAGSGKSTLVTTLVIALALTHTPREAQVYCLDPDGALRTLNGLPHVGAVADDPETADAVVAKLTAPLDTPAGTTLTGTTASGTTAPGTGAAGTGAASEDVFLVIDGPVPAEHAAALGRLAADGPHRGIHLILTSEHRADTFLTDARELRLDGAQPGRGVDGGARFVTALPRLDGVESADGLDTAVSTLVTEIAEYWGDRPGAPGVRALPASVSAAGLPPPRHRLEAVLGVSAGDLAPVAHDFTTTPHLLIAGEAGSGKTNLLRLVARSITEGHRTVEARILIVDYQGGLLHTIPEEFVLGHAFSSGVLGELVDGTVHAIGERMADQSTTRTWHGPRLFILVDDYVPGDAAYRPLKPLREYLALGYELGAHIVVATAADPTDPFLDALLDAGAGTLRLSGTPEPRGRARYRTGGETSLIQTALD